MSLQKQWQKQMVNEKPPGLLHLGDGVFVVNDKFVSISDLLRRIEYLENMING